MLESCSEEDKVHMKRGTMERTSFSLECDFFPPTSKKQDMLASVSADEMMLQGGLVQMK